MEIVEVLEDLGFQDVEIKVYLFLLRQGPVSQQIISDKTGILRQTIYEVMKKMELKGYVCSSLSGRRNVYYAVEPDILLNSFKNKEENFLQVLPELNKFRQNNISGFSSQNFIGIKGLKNLFNLTLSSKSVILWFCNRNMSDKIFQGFYWHNYSQKRIQNKIPIKLLIEPDNQKDWDTNKKLLRNTRRNAILDNLKSSFVVFDNNVIIYSMENENLYGLLIKNDLIKEMFGRYFNFLWKQSK
ncbi:MAG: helix-turn-helix domain-containing protein [Candidatus Diapherotrites archaeon]